MFEILAHTKPIGSEVVVEKPLLNGIGRGLCGFGQVVDKTRSEADLRVEKLAGSQRLIAFDKVNDVVGHLIVAAPRHISEVVIHNNGRNIAVLLENGSRFQLKGGTGGNARNILTEL